MSDVLYASEGGHQGLVMSYDLDVEPAQEGCKLNVETEFHPGEHRAILNVMDRHGFETYADTVRWLVACGLGMVAIDPVETIRWFRWVYLMIAFATGVAIDHFEF